MLKNVIMITDVLVVRYAAPMDADILVWSQVCNLDSCFVYGVRKIHEVQLFLFWSTSCQCMIHSRIFFFRRGGEVAVLRCNYIDKNHQDKTIYNA